MKLNKQECHFGKVTCSEMWGNLLSPKHVSHLNVAFSDSIWNKQITKLSNLWKYVYLNLKILRFFKTLPSHTKECTVGQDYLCHSMKSHYTKTNQNSPVTNMVMLLQNFRIMVTWLYDRNLIRKNLRTFK